MEIPYENLTYNRRTFSHQNLTLLILTVAFLLGYNYARLRKDEYMRRRCYTKMSNFMILFDKYSVKYETILSTWSTTISQFDFGRELWRKKRIWVEEQREVRRRQREITEKQGKGDEVSEVIGMLETVAEGEGVTAQKAERKLR